ncbi:MAG: endonuclease domain-containing protein [Tepidisphaeraceae bacterium]
MRHDAVPAEDKLWQCIRNRQLCGYKFRRQQPIGPFIADFYCSQSRLILECDGASHADRQAYDERRTEWLNDNNHTVLRIENGAVHESLDAVLEAILMECDRRCESLGRPLAYPSPPAPLPQGERGENA